MNKLLIAAAASLPAWGVAHAEDAEYTRVRVGLGAQYRPEFPGADKNKIAPLVYVQTARGTSQFRFYAPDDSLSIPLLAKGGFRAGVVGHLADGRKDEDVGAALGRVDTTIEAGGFAQYDFGDSFRVRTEVRKGIGGHEGLVGAVGVDKIWRDGDRYVFSVGPRLLFANGRYQRAYFGLSPAASLATGLPSYRPDGGLYGVAVASGLSYQLNQKFGMFGFARYERLIDNAADSPIVRRFGSRDQYSIGFGLNYSFNVSR